MSKIGKQPIKVGAGIRISIGEDSVKIGNDKNELVMPILDGVRPVLNVDEFTLELIKETKQARSNWGTMRALVANAVLGLSKEFEKVLILEGVGYRVSKDDNGLVLNLGFSHPVRYPAQPGLTFEIEAGNVLKIKGVDKMRVGQVAAEIRALKKPEPYKGKGIRYKDEVVRRKAGKKAATSGT